MVCTVLSMCVHCHFCQQELVIQRHCGASLDYNLLQSGELRSEDRRRYVRQHVRTHQTPQRPPLSWISTTTAHVLRLVADARTKRRQVGNTEGEHARRPLSSVLLGNGICVHNGRGSRNVSGVLLRTVSRFLGNSFGCQLNCDFLLRVK